MPRCPSPLWTSVFSVSRLAWLLAASLAIPGCADQAPPAEAPIAQAAAEPSPPESAPVPPSPTIDDEFLSRAAIYEVNVRQFSEAGTLAEVTRQLPRLKALGVDILWLMPIQPIGEAKRKGALGSYYSIRDYTAVHPDYGTLDDVRQLVDAAHTNGQIVILDWVANHTAWDHPWLTAHPDWYTRDENGQVIDPINPETGEPWGWTDVADLNYGNDELWLAMADAMAFWLRETGMDGFRCDVAGEVPTAFWEYVRPRLEAVKPVFMLAEAEKPELANVFDMSYGWGFHHVMNDIASGELNADVIDAYMEDRDARFPRDHALMMFTTNHDENSWSGTVFERYGLAHKAFAVLAFTLDGMPLIYSGQEAGLDKRLEFFSSDPIDWKDESLPAFYAGLLALKDQHAALAHGEAGGAFVPLEFSSRNPNAYAFRRSAADSSVTVVVNLSNEAAAVVLDEVGLEEREVLFGEAIIGGRSINLDPHGFVIVAGD